MITTTKDQMGRDVRVPRYPERIISLVPSQTELLFHLGVGDRVVGITKFCIHPEEWRSTKTVVGGTKNFLFDAIATLDPDLIIGNKEENYEDGINALMNDYPVWMSDINNLEDALAMIRSIGYLVDRESEAELLVKEIENSFRRLLLRPARRVLYLIWRKPWMAAGINTFIGDMLSRIGLENAVTGGRYPELTTDRLKAIDPEIVLLSSEPYPFAEKHALEIRNIFPEAKIIFVDGEMFSWYGSRLQFSASYFNSLEL